MSVRVGFYHRADFGAQREVTDGGEVVLQRRERDLRPGGTREMGTFMQSMTGDGKHDYTQQIYGMNKKGAEESAPLK